MVLYFLKPLYTFGTEKKNALLFEKTLKQLSILDNENYGFIVNTC